VGIGPAAVAQIEQIAFGYVHGCAMDSPGRKEDVRHRLEMRETVEGETAFQADKFLVDLVILRLDLDDRPRRGAQQDRVRADLPHTVDRLERHRAAVRPRQEIDIEMGDRVPHESHLRAAIAPVQ
jgi:hypothetical protein